MYDPHAEPDIFGKEAEEEEENHNNEGVEHDMNNMSEDDFLNHYKATKAQYKIIQVAIQHLRKAAKAIDEMGALNIDPEIIENTQFLIDDYNGLLEQMQMASYWEREGR